MKNLITILITVLLAGSVFAQSPEKISYQAVVRDSRDSLVSNTLVGMQISILQGSLSGNTVYIETQNATTNSNGLVSLEIGTGLSNDNFSEINWENGPYFIKTEIAIAPPLTNYTITGISELLSVPFALYAKSAGSIAGSNCHFVGELYGGGVVFWVDDTRQHGLIVSMIDLSSSQEWSNVIDVEIGTTKHWDGANNTVAIIEQNGHSSSAAQLCTNYINADYGTGSYDDWYLPSFAELNHLWNNIYEVHKAIDSDNNSTTRPLELVIYWSSTEDSSVSARVFNFSLGGNGALGKSNSRSVRAIRSF
jgi:hypothetical protein